MQPPDKANYDDTDLDSGDKNEVRSENLPGYSLKMTHLWNISAKTSGQLNNIFTRCKKKRKIKRNKYH